MTKQKGICQECNKEYEYEYNPKYPRKYCPACSAKKKAEFESKIAPGVKDEKPEVVKIGKKIPCINPEDYKNLPKETKNYTTMYVSYAKDIFCALGERFRKDMNLNAPDELMEVSIKLVKQAKEAFE